jgi:pimeloyl-ACP methyl ester carboxylesterase
MQKAKWGKRITIAAVLLAAALLPYPWVINSCSFYPLRGNLPAAHQLPAGIQERIIPTEDGERLFCYWLPRPPSDWAIAYFHGNSGNIGQHVAELNRLADMGFNVLGVDYRGFGKSSGRPSESGIYKDGRAALKYLVKEQGFKMQRIVLMGVSIGSCVALEIARDEPVGAVVLVTPLTSGKAVVEAGGHHFLAWFAGDVFDNLSRIGRIRSPLLIIAGSADQTTPAEMGRQLYAKATRPKQLVVIPGAHHNDIASFAPDVYWGALRTFFALLKPAQSERPLNAHKIISRGRRK